MSDDDNSSYDYHPRLQKLEDGSFFALPGKQHSGEAHGRQFGILEDILWPIAKKPENID